ncbi:nucleotidyltransferase domain-containing protein [Acidianus sp. HS-5]|uniref:nucleotidyltransferase domain-containing protein n=1 Tax=Acidianus sp. HS-5 TaxID=2886040 RepID=UPI001F46B0AE|nr:nucleotidyltransferase domain-containing protein [Acidianus sp. HS-5]
MWGLDYIKYLENNWLSIAKKVKAIAEKHGKVDKVIVFGSVIKGKVTGSSDLDIAVFYNEELTSKEKIRRTLEILDEVNEEIADIDLQVLSKSEEEFFLKFVGEYVEV